MFAWGGGNILLLAGGEGFNAFILALFYATLYLVGLFTLIRFLAGEKELEYPLRTLISQKYQNFSPMDEASQFLLEDYNTEY